ncbi:outer membrane beta-barrel protein [Kaarinaea lacus]
MSQWCRWFALVALICLLPIHQSHAKQYPRVVIVDPFIELHTGPGKGYPIFHVVERNEWVEVMKRRTDWFKVQDREGNVGWVLIDQMEKTLSAPGVQTQFKKIARQHFGERTFEGGLQFGDFEGSALMNIYAGYNFNSNLAVEIDVGQAAGKNSNTDLARVSVLSTPFPNWKLSPFFTIGSGYLKTEPKKGVFADGSSNNFASVGLGVRYYLSRRLFLRADIKQNIVFIDDDNSGEFLEWKLGFSFFY